MIPCIVLSQPFHSLKSHSPTLVTVVDKRLLTPLHEAAINGQSDCVAAMLKYNPPIHVKDEIGMTALDMACQSGEKKTVKLLLDKGSTLSYSKFGTTAMHRAAHANHHEIVEMLASYKWDVNIVSEFL